MKEDKNATLFIYDEDKFFNDIWQCDGSFTQQQWKEVIKNFASILQDAYDFLDCEYFTEQGKPINYPDDNLYIIGDIINMLSSISVKGGKYGS